MARPRPHPVRRARPAGHPARLLAALPGPGHGRWVTDSPNPCTGRQVPLDFRFHVAMAGVLAVGGDLAEWSQADLGRAAELVAAYKRIRPLVQHGRQYRLLPPDGELSAVQSTWSAKSPDGG
ncbi:alpha-galactosidase [Nonomuraea helvata]|uniref:alpha-galactosidase n=1 Tax=Nonomuraea helvata TaxID=37484 RepID=UPI003CD0BE31